MKTINKILKSFSVLLISILFSCTTNVLDLSPLDAISDAQYWKTSNDLYLYANQFYTAFPKNEGWFTSPLWKDIDSDDLIPGDFNRRLAGENTITAGNDNWTFSRIRSVNYGLENYSRIDEPFESIQNGVGELNFFKAYFYFNLVKNYGDVPWISNTLNIDSEELYAPRTARNIVIDSILLHLDKAIEYLPLKSESVQNRLNKESALLFKSRVALYEGSWEKYHSQTPFGVNNANPNKYFKLAAQAAKELIDLGTVRLYSPADPKNYYRELFGNYDYSSISEILMWNSSDGNLEMNNYTQNSLTNHAGDRGLSKSLMESFLCTDGLPISVSPLYQGDESVTSFVSGRDPRCAQSIWLPGDVFRFNGSKPQLFTLPWIDATGETRCTTGYQQAKGRTVRVELGNSDSETAAIIFRYAEALLNYAEAKAELGDITQNDIDISINKLRQRVNMPDLIINDIADDPNWLYPDVSPLLNEIRRERRVELACEGFRFDDLARWAALDLLVGKRPKGYRFVQTDFPNLVVGNNIFLDAGGYLDPYQKSLPNGYLFNVNRDYLLPVPEQQITLNENLVQNPGWKIN